MEAFNEKSKEKAQLMAILMEVSSIQTLHDLRRVVLLLTRPLLSSKVERCARSLRIA